MRVLSLLCLTFLLSVACGDDDTIMLDSSADASFDGSRADVSEDGPPPLDEGVDAMPISDWIVRTHPCPGINRTDAFSVDDDTTMWIGCGSGAEGDGLFRSEDGGGTWEIPTTTPSNVLSSLRVLSVHRGADGLLYVAGQDSDTQVISLDTSSEPYAATAVLTSGTTVGTKFLTGPFVTTAGGAAFADSFNGFDALYRPDDSVGADANDWTEAGDWETSDSSHQILDLVALGETFVGCGSTIAEPPLVFLPSRTAGDPAFKMTPVPLVDGLGSYTGEMWGVAASDARVIVVGVDQDNNIGKIFVSGADRYEATDYTQTDVDGLLPARVSASDTTWSRGVCMMGDRVVVVGEIQPLGVGDNTGFVLESTDGGASFSDITPVGSPDTWSKCVIDSNRLSVAGAGKIGFIAN